MVTVRRSGCKRLGTNWRTREEETIRATGGEANTSYSDLQVENDPGGGAPLLRSPWWRREGHDQRSSRGIHYKGKLRMRLAAQFVPLCDTAWRFRTKENGYGQVEAESLFVE